MKHVFYAIIEEDIIPWNRLSDDKKNQFASEARAILEMEYWKRMTDSVKWKAQMQMFEKSQSYEDMFFGKASLYVIDIIDKRIKSISEFNKISD